MKSQQKSLVAVALKSVSIVVVLITMFIVALPVSASAKTKKENISTNLQVFRIEKIVTVLQVDEEVSYSILQPDGTWAKQAKTSLLPNLDHFEGQVFVGFNPPKIIMLFCYNLADSRLIIKQLSEAGNKARIDEIRAMVLTLNE